MNTVLIIGAGGVGWVVAHKCAMNINLLYPFLAHNHLLSFGGIRSAIPPYKLKHIQYRQNFLSYGEYYFNRDI